MALDNCAVYFYRAPEGMPEGKLNWPLEPEAAQAALPDTLTPSASRRIVYRGKPCYEFLCADGERQVRVTVDAEYGRELSVEVERAA